MPHVPPLMMPCRKEIESAWLQEASRKCLKVTPSRQHIQMKNMSFFNHARALSAWQSNTAFHSHPSIALVPPKCLNGCSYLLWNMYRNFCESVSVSFSDHGDCQCPFDSAYCMSWEIQSFRQQGAMMEWMSKWMQCMLDSVTNSLPCLIDTRNHMAGLERLYELYNIVDYALLSLFIHINTRSAWSNAI